MDLVDSIPYTISYTAVQYPAFGLPGGEGFHRNTCGLWLAFVIYLVFTDPENTMAQYFARKCYMICQAWFLKHIADAKRALQRQDWTQDLGEVSPYFRIFGKDLGPFHPLNLCPPFQCARASQALPGKSTADIPQLVP